MFIKEFENTVREVLKLPGLILKANRQWGSTTPDSRLAIRRDLVNELRARSWAASHFEIESQMDGILDLERRPSFRFASISISHCRPLGGYALLPGENSIGLDIEEVRRISRAACERIATPEEMSLEKISADFRLLWPAKEAAFKALALDGRAISNVIVHDWRAIGGGFFAFEARAETGRRASGIAAVIAQDGLTIALVHS